MIARLRSALVLALVVAGCSGDDSAGGDAGGGGGGGDGGGTATGRDAAHAACVDETNRYRAMDGKSPIAYSAQLEAYADEGAMFDFSANPHDHFSTTNGGGIAFAENECPAQLGWTLSPGADQVPIVKDCVAAFYSEGPGGGHYDNMMGPYAKLGCGIYQSGSGITIVQDFGN